MYDPMLVRHRLLDVILVQMQIEMITMINTFYCNEISALNLPQVMTMAHFLMVILLHTAFYPTLLKKFQFFSTFIEIVFFPEFVQRSADSACSRGLV